VSTTRAVRAPELVAAPGPAPVPGAAVAVPADASRLLLTRHAQTVWHAENRYAGHSSDIDLTETGRRQVEALAAWARLRSPDAVVCSPVRRAVETARPCAEASGRALQVVDDLREVDFGVAEGHTLAELRTVDAEMVHQFSDDPARYPFPGAEPPAVAAERCAAALREVAGSHLGRTVLVVAHNTVLRLGLCALLGLPVGRYRQLFPRLDNASVTEISVPRDRSSPASLLSLNARISLS